MDLPAGWVGCLSRMEVRGYYRLIFFLENHIANGTLFGPSTLSVF